MEASRRIHLRHADGFTARHFALFRVGCEEWRGFLAAVTNEWELLYPGKPMTPYHFGSAVLSEDTKTATLPLAGGDTYFMVKMFEDFVPDQLYRHLPFWFQVDLEWAYENSWIDGVPKCEWLPVHSEDRRNEMRATKLFAHSREYDR